MELKPDIEEREHSKSFAKKVGDRALMACSVAWDIARIVVTGGEYTHSSKDAPNNTREKENNV